MERRRASGHYSSSEAAKGSVQKHTLPYSVYPQLCGSGCFGSAGDDVTEVSSYPTRRAKFPSCHNSDTRTQKTHTAVPAKSHSTPESFPLLPLLR